MQLGIRLDSYETILQGLQQAAETRAEVSDTIKLYVDLLSVQAQANASVRLPALDASAAAALLQQGTPLLVPDAFEVDADTFLGLCSQIVLTTATHRSEFAQSLAQIHVWLLDKRYQIETLACEYLYKRCIQGSKEAGIDSDLLAFVLNNALRPFLHAYAERLAALVDLNDWYRGICPVCGGEPDFAILERESGARRLLCSLCDMEWHCTRMGCPYCGEETGVAYFLSDDHVYRLYVCETCRRYLKTRDQREGGQFWPLAVERILTVNMDTAARSSGYR